MTERKLQIETIFKMVLVIICASLYAWGGIEMKWLRRFLAPSICAVGCLILSKDWRVLIKAPLLGLASSIGYGADETIWKVIKRGYVALAFIVAINYDQVWTIIRDNEKKLWFWVGFSSLTILSAYIILGVWNPLPARLEESILGLVVYTMAIMPIQRRTV